MNDEKNFSAIKDGETSAEHEGVIRRSGRYPYGSGDNPYQRNKNFVAYVNSMKRKGLTDAQIAKGMDMKSTQLRAKLSIASNYVRKEDHFQATQLKNKGYSNVAIGKKMGISESSVRSLLDKDTHARKLRTENTANLLKEQVREKGYIDVGVGVERHLGVSRTRLKTAIAMLEEDGYKTHDLRVQQLGTGKETSLLVLTTDDVTYSQAYHNRDKIAQINEYSYDGGETYLGMKTPKSVSSKRVSIVYAEDGGTEKDGVIEIRKGVEDISLGNKKYAQARIAVDDKLYLKGMVVYADDLPPGIDLRFNTNKKVNTPFEKVLKPMKMTDAGEIDPDNPFGATVKQREYITSKGAKDPKAKEMLELSNKGLSHEAIAKRMRVSVKDVDKNIQLSSVNIVYEEGDWSQWSKNLSSQMLSKQTPALAKKQLGTAYDIKKAEYDEIMSLTNPVVKKKLLDSFADDCDSAAVHLKAAALPRQGSHVILPIPKMKDNEIYAPGYRDGEDVVLIRYPHGGTFEIPALRVNNKNRDAKKVMGQAIDAVGINSRVAERLSGADFDGDTVLVIPNPGGKLVKSTAPLRGLENFDPKALYKLPDSAPRMKDSTKQQEMGKISNLITDMTIRGAESHEIARAVRHSMVVIDAEKHHLDYKKSFKDNNIGELKKKYQGATNAGASTLISKASSEYRVPHRKEGIKDPKTGRRLYIDPNTGEKLYTYTGETYVRKRQLKDGTVKEKVIERTTESTKMYEQKDAHKLSSGTPMEKIYADHANKLKALGNQSRKQTLLAKNEFQSANKAAKEKYASEIETLDAKLNIALKNAPRERQAQIVANTIVKMKQQDNPHMDNDSLKKIKGQALAAARARTGASKDRVKIEPKEWEAIQAGAISPSKLSKILNNTDLDVVKKYATPRTENSLSTSQAIKARNLLQNGHTQADIASHLGVSTSTINKLINE